MKTRYNLLAFIFIGLLGSLGHFFYEWSSNNKIIGYFFATNESTWEHLKLLFFPTIIYSIIEYFFVKGEIQNYIPSVIISVIVGMISIIALFYTYRGILGYNIDFLNIAIYYVSIIIMLIVKNVIINKELFATKSAALIFSIIGIFISILFLRFTYFPPTLNIFKSPLSE